MNVRWTQWTKAFAAVIVVVLMALGGLQLANLGAGTMASAALPTSPAAATSSATPALSGASPAAVSGGASVPVQGVAEAPTQPSAAVTPDGGGPHPGTLDVYEAVPGGATTEDPAVAYDTTSYEPILNVYQTLVSYNGSSTATFVPTLATCVPGQGTQCTTDYGGGFTGIYNTTGKVFTGSNGHAEYWSFVIDPAARFYDPSTKASWPVYPSDVMFSVSRTLAFADLPYATKTAGWIIAQSLLPPGKTAWDNATHAPYNNTPEDVLGSMLINDSSFCPTKAMNGVDGNGCITFVADGTNQVWPEFLDFVEDNLGSSVVPCGWYTSVDAGIPGWAGTHAANGDGSCLLPDGGNATNNTAWKTYLTDLKPASWDTFEGLMANYPAPQPNVRWSMVGSGPYYASVNPGISYALAPNPAYTQPSGCSGAHGLAVYTGYCDPAANKYIPNVDVTWETAKEGDSLGTDAIEAGTADFAGIYTTETSTLLGYVHSGLWQYDLFPTLSTGFTPINLGVDYSAYNTTFAGTPLESNPIPPDLFTDIGLRNFYIDAYPYTTIENTINTVDTIQYAFNAGGPIPFGMGNYYPANVSWPYLEGNPTQPSSTVGSAAWWWAQITSPTSPYYNATVAKKCTSSDPCTWPIGYWDGEPSQLTEIDDWAGDVYNLSGHALSPWPLALTFTQFLSDTLIGPYESPLVSETGFGWAPDYPDPTDYMAPMAQPAGDYTNPDTWNSQLFLPQYENNKTCGHYGIATEASAYANLTYWAHQAEAPQNDTLTSSCQGVAYSVASYWMATAGALAASAQRILDYNLVEQITNALGMYIYNGQTNELVGFAPWINASSINENPVIGGGGDSIWFQIQYSTKVYNVTVSESGLPTGTKWTATVGGATLNATTASIVFPGLPNGTYNFSVGFEAGYSVSPSNGSVKISGAPLTQDVTYTSTAPALTSDVTFRTTGLASNTTWALVVSGFGAQRTNGPALVFALPDGATYDYQAQNVLGYTAPAGSSVTVVATPLTVTVAYVGVFAPAFALTFTESGLPGGSNWSVTLGSPGSGYTLYSTTATITFYEPNGSFPVTFLAPAGYVGPISPAEVVVNGVLLDIAVPFAATHAAFLVTFTETGLNVGQAWAVTIGNLTVNSTSRSLNFSLPNGTYPWAIIPIPSWIATSGSGNVTVAGKAVAVSIKFALFTYEVTFFEGGLAKGAKWSVTVGNASGNVTLTSTTYSIVANLSNGTFTYTIGAVAGYAATPPNGTVVVNASSASIVTIFGPIPAKFTVTFTATGLAAGATWTVFFGGVEKNGTGPSSLIFSVTNGSWTFSTLASGYTALPSGGSVLVSGAAKTETIAFTVPSTPSPAWSYLGTLSYALIGLLAFLAVLGLGLAAHYHRRRTTAAPPESWTQGSPPGKDGKSPPSGPDTPP